MYRVTSCYFADVSLGLSIANAHLQLAVESKSKLLFYKVEILSVSDPSSESLSLAVENEDELAIATRSVGLGQCRQMDS